jgi:uncharacterized protein
MPSDPTYLGTVEDVSGASVGVLLDESTVSGLAFVEGHGYRIGQVGSFVRVAIGYVDLFGIVTKVGASAVPEKLSETEPYGRRWMRVELMGESDGTGPFRRGLSQYPTVGDQVHLITRKDLARVYGQSDAPNLIQIGHLASAESIPTLVDIDKLLTRHSAVVGSTGAGKSTSVANLLVSLTEKGKFPSARILVLDVHGEYHAALKDRAVVFKIGAKEARGEGPLFVPYWAMNFDELLSVSTGSLGDNAKARGAMQERVRLLKLESWRKHPRSGVTKDNLTVDSPVPFSIHKLWFDLHCESYAIYRDVPGMQFTREFWALEIDDKGTPVEQGDMMNAKAPLFRTVERAAGAEKTRWGTSNLNIGSAVDALGSKLRDPRFNFLFRPGPWAPDADGQTKEDLDSLLAGWIGGPYPIAILDLSGIPVPVLKDLIGALLRIIYDSLFWARELKEGGRQRPLLVVLEEAHSYLEQGDRGPAALAVKRVAKEGRKYGMGAMVVSQRPAEVDSTILSQCGTFFAMRLSNQTDRGHVTGAVTDNLAGLLDMLPSMRTGEMIIVGEAVRLPVRTILDPPTADRKPDSSDPLVYGGPDSPSGWDKARGGEDYKAVVDVWRAQDPRFKSKETPTEKKEE